MSTKNIIRVVVLAALAAWPSVEVYRYRQAQQQRDAAQQQEIYMSARLAQLKSRNAHPAEAGGDTGVQPVVNQQ